jgi:hypothetical protein
MNRSLLLTLLVTMLAAPVPALAGPASPLRLPPVSTMSSPLAADDDPERIRKLVRQRRGMMNAHQALSIALIPVLGATAAIGTINRARMDSGQPVTAEALALHRGFAIGSASLYTTTGVLAITAPHPLRGQMGGSGASGNRDSGRVHRALAIAHLSVFAALMVTGIIDANASLPADAYQVLNKVHLVEGWALFGLVTTSGIVIATF